MWDWMDEDVLNVYNAMELEKGLATLWRWTMWIFAIRFWTYMMMKICLCKYVVWCNVVDGIGSL